jgi:hypothetical protein
MRRSVNTLLLAKLGELEAERTESNSVLEGEREGGGVERPKEGERSEKGVTGGVLR